MVPSVRLSAVLSLALLVLECEAAFNAAGGSSLLELSGRHHHHHMVHHKQTPKKEPNWQCYLDRYADLTKAFGTDLQAAENHYKEHGEKEGRNCYCGAAPLTKAQEFVKADIEAQEDFVRRCEVVVTVSDSKFLPVNPLDKFCRTTDAVMECRLKVGQRLKETHAREGDMGKFCSAVYDWFQGKYGMKCPSQCKKLQCKSTCMWLDAKRNLNKENMQIKDEMFAAEGALKNIKAMGQKIHEKLQAEKKGNFSIKMFNVKLGRAKASLTEAKTGQNSSSTKMNKVNAAYTKLENTIEATKVNIMQQDDALMKQKFAIDKAKLKYEAMTRSVQRHTDRAKEDREEEKSLQTDSGKLGDSIAELTKQKASLNATKTKDLKVATAKAAELKGKVEKMMKATKELDAWKVASFMQNNAPTTTQCACENPGHPSFKDCTKSKACTCTGKVRIGYGNKWSSWTDVTGSIQCASSNFGGDPFPGQAKECQCQVSPATVITPLTKKPLKSWNQEYAEYMEGNYKNDPAVPIIKELIENQHKRAKVTANELEMVQKKIRDTTDEIKEIDADIARLKKQQKEADDAADAAKKKATDLEKKVKDGEGAAVKFKADSITKPEGLYKTAEEKRKKTEASKLKAERTLKHMMDLVKEQKAKLDAANAAVSNVNMALTAVENDIAKSSQDLKNSQNDTAYRQKKEKDAKEKLAAEEKALVARIKVYKTEAKDLDKHKPEIVKQHRLQPEL